MTRVYLIVLSGVVAAAMLIAGVVFAGDRIATHHAAGSAAPVWAAWALCLLWSLAWLGVANRLGPVTAAPATVAWILPSPLDRGKLLRPGAIWVCAAGGLVGSVNGVLVVHARAPDVPSAVGMLGAGAGGGVFAAAALVLLQTHVGRRWPYALSVAALAAEANVVVVGVVALVTVAFALSTLDRMRLARIAAGSAYAQVIVAGFVTVDPGLAARAAEQLTAGRGGRLAGTGWKAIVSQDILALRRSPGRLLMAAGLAAMPALIGEMFGSGALMGAVWVLCGLSAVGLTTTNVRRDHDIDALPRLLGLTARRLLAARAVVPAVFGVVWGLCSIGPVGAAAGLALAAGAMRAARRGRV
uniref:DUF6297 family protein n=1 Tax=Allorhizocola rhizosphaerae TaxID=1872709 RepID=UPI001FE5320F